MGLLKRLFGGGKEYGGVIDDLNLVDFWGELTEEERDKIRETSGKGWGKCIDYCQKDITLYEEKLRNEKFFKENEPRVHVFKRLAIIYKKQERYKEAIEVCKKAIRYDMRDGTKSGFEGRLERLKRELE